MLTSLQNPLVKQMRKLHRAKERREQQLFLLEGTHLLMAAQAADRAPATVCYTAAWQARYGDLWDWASHRADRTELVSPDVLRAIATTVEPDGVVATLPRFAITPPHFTRLGLVLDTIQDPGNLGTMIRTAAAAGAEGLLLSADSVDPDHPKVLRASAGQWFQLPVGVSADLPATLHHYRQQGFQIIATQPTATQTYWQVDFCKPTLVLLGNEGAGLSAAVADTADTAVTIPLAPGVESLNVAIAAALLLYEARRQWTVP
jgi:RNA methyltransferase, TrmH family